MLAVAGAVAVEDLDSSDVDVGIAAHYGDPVREQRILATEVGLVDRSNRGVLAVSGADRLSFLHSLTTQHLSDLAPMSGTELLVLSPHGHVEHHAVVLDAVPPHPVPPHPVPPETPDAQASDIVATTWLDVEPGTAGAVVDFLNRMRFLMRVDPVEVTADWAVLSLVGPFSDAAAAALGARALAVPARGVVPRPKFAAGTVPPGPTSRYDVVALPGGGYARRMRYGVDLLVPRTAVPDVVAGAGVPLAGVWAFEALRVADRRPRLGRDTDHRTLPAEVGWLADAVHLDKGCYRGQETVARVHHLGRPPRRLVLLHLDGVTTDELPPVGTPVTTAEGRTVGFVGTAVRHFELGPVALAMVRQNVPDDASLRAGPCAAAIDPGPP